ncbi:MAG TPA: ABC transporter permease, partial [Longimicrobiaceae bacterium]|nr:ABC transporter permease [Longimicrobiaceae bacterium]
VSAFADMRGRHPGYEGDRLMTVRFGVPGWKYTEPDEVRGLLDRVIVDVGEAPGVENAALVSTLPEHILASTDTFRVAGQPVEHGRAVPRAISLRASPDYFETMGIPLLQGRVFEDSDRAGSAPVVMVSQMLAERRFPGRAAIGERLDFRGESREIVGVAGNVSQTLLSKASGEPEETIYLPIGQATMTGGYVVARTTGDPRAAAAPIEARISAIDPDITIIDSHTMKEFAGRFLGTFDALNWILGTFVTFALILASLGTYGVVAYAVSRRRHEIGVRGALGAAPTRVVWMFAREGMAMSLVGLAAGVLLMLPVVAVAQDVIEVQGLAPVKLGFLAGVGALLFAVTVAASVVPAVRAARVDPARVLKVE